MGKGSLRMINKLPTEVHGRNAFLVGETEREVRAMLTGTRLQVQMTEGILYMETGIIRERRSGCNMILQQIKRYLVQIFIGLMTIKASTFLPLTHCNTGMEPHGLT